MYMQPVLNVYKQPPPIGLWALRSFFYFKLTERRIGVELFHKQKPPLLGDVFLLFIIIIYYFSNTIFLVWL